MIQANLCRGENEPAERAPITLESAHDHGVTYAQLWFSSQFYLEFTMDGLAELVFQARVILANR